MILEPTISSACTASKPSSESPSSIGTTLALVATEEFSLNDSDWSDVIQSVRDAGSRILQVMDQQALGVYSKSDGSPVTEADRQANQVILDFLKLRFPEIPCVSEESTHLTGQLNCWLIDPLDGTKEFLSGRAEFTVNLAMVAKGVPVA